MGCLYARLQGWDTAALRAGGPVPLAGDRLLINYSGPSSRVYQRLEGLTGGLVVCPSHLVAAGIYPPGFFAGRVVLVGSGLDDAPDRYRTPFFSAAYSYEKTHGVEIHAQLLRTLVDESKLSEWGGGCWWLAALLLAVAVATVVRQAGAICGGVVTAMLMLVLFGAGFMLFTHHRVVMPLVASNSAVLLAYGLATYGGRNGAGTVRLQAPDLDHRLLPRCPALLAGDPARPGPVPAGP